MKVFFALLTLGVLSVLSCKKETVQEPYGICGTGLYDVPADTTEMVPQNPDATARVATLTQTNSAGETFTQNLFYNGAGFLDSVVGTGSEVHTYTRTFTHTPSYTLVRVYNAAGVSNKGLDSISLNAAGYPIASYKSLNGTMQLISFFAYNSEEHLISRQNNYEPNRYTYTTYNRWEKGNLETFDVSSGNPAFIFQYTYFMLAPSMPGEPHNLKDLLEFGRPLKHSINLRIRERKEGDKDPSMLVYKWYKCRIANWTKDGGKTVTAALTYYN